MKNKFFLLLCCVLFCFAASACAKPEQDDILPADALVIENYGRELVFVQPPQAVLTFGPNCTELFVALGLGDLVVGKSLDNHSRGPLAEYAEQYNAIPTLTYGYPTREAVISSNADFAYGIDWVVGQEGVEVEDLQQAGIQLYVNSAETPEQLWQEIADLGRIFGVEDRAAELIRDQRTRIEAVQLGLADEQPLRVLVFDDDTPYTAGGPNLETQLIELAGGVNIFADVDKAWTSVSYEEIVARDPQVIIVHDYDAVSAEEKIAAISSHALLSTLECVQQQRFVVLSLEAVFPGPRMALTVETLAEGFFPHLY